MTEKKLTIIVIKKGKHTSLYEKACLFIKENYEKKLKVNLETFPPIILTAINEEEIIGTLGFNSGRETKPLLVESYFDFDVLEKLIENDTTLNDCKVNNERDIAEIGSLSIKSGYIKMVNLTMILTAAIVLLSKKNGYKWIILTTMTNIQKIAEPLGIQLINIGAPDISKKDEDFKKNWEHYFDLKPTSVGFKVNQALPGCLVFLKKHQDIVDYKEVL